ncbi:MAG TPA: hypothetical protein VFE05_12675 [Longimicrobiaceae bacterium]|jgi:hypothetical protein|nr:hypothetical protein [Longimicrobiaceae bacterium]
MRRILAALLPLVLSACVPRYRVAEWRDDFEQTETRQMRANVLAGEGTGHDWLALDAESSRTRGDTARYALVVDYRTSGHPLRVPAGETLVLLVDSQRVALRGAGSSGHRARSGVRGDREQARYPVFRTLLERIAAARIVRVRLAGQRYYVERSFSTLNLRHLREFLAPPAPKPPRTPTQATTPQA